MNLRNYIAETTVSSDAILDDWRWLISTDLEVWLVTLAGDALLKDCGDGSIHFLDAVSGTVERIADNEAAFEQALTSPENADHWLMPEVVDRQALLGMTSGVDECLSFKHPPVFGGELSPDNFETCNVLVHFSIAGQIHRQIKDLPPGTKIGRIEIKEPGGSSTRPWWKFW